MAVLFFILGATLGRGTVDQWLGYVGLTKKAENPNATAEPKPPAQTVDEMTSQPAQGTTPNNAGTAQGEKEGRGAKPTVETPSAARSGTELPTGSSRTPSDSALGDTDRSPVRGGVKRVTPEAGDSTLSRRGEVNEGRAGGPPAETVHEAGEHSILVNAPEAGNPTFFVNLPSETVSASGNIAISVQRSIEIAPRKFASSYVRAERVVIGKLMSHSEPFYPADARNRRIEGSVELRARIGRAGGVLDVTQIAGSPVLGAAAVTALRDWRYAPTYIDGDPAETQADVTIFFRLR
jgi:TonB family protein